MSCSASTDNLGNACVLRRWLTARFPLSCVVMEIAAILQQRNLDLSLEWVPRLQNTEADALTNADYRGFNPALRLDEYEGIVLQGMLENGAEIDDDIKAAWKGKVAKVQKAKSSLRVTDPWDG